MVFFRRLGLVLLVGLTLASCAHAPPQLVQVFEQVTRFYDPVAGSWSPRLTVFVQAASSDGEKVFDRLHLVHDGEGLFVTVNQAQWTRPNRPGETWIGTANVAFPDGAIPTGPWRALLVTRDGQKVESSFAVPPAAPDAPAARGSRVIVTRDRTVPGRFTVSGWPDDYLVWAVDAQGTVLTRTKTTGAAFTVPGAAVSFFLYSYDKNRGEGLEAGPFPVQSSSKSADR